MCCYVSLDATQTLAFERGAILHNLPSIFSRLLHLLPSLLRPISMSRSATDTIMMILSFKSKSLHDSSVVKSASQHQRLKRQRQTMKAENRFGPAVTRSAASKSILLRSKPHICVPVMIADFNVEI